MENRSSYLIKIHAAHRWIVWKYLQPIYGHIRIAEFPKSGGTWLGQMLAHVSGLPFPRNTSLPLFNSCVQHSHAMGPSSHKTILVVRDVRDVMTSAYFHFLIQHEEKDPHLLRYWKGIMKDANVNDVKNTMPLFIKRFHSSFQVARQPINWSSHTASYLKDKNLLLIIKYEDLLQDASLQLENIVDWLEIVPVGSIDDATEKFSFRNQTNRVRGEENRAAFLRKGVSGDWKNHFNEESKALATSLYGATMKKLGYV